MRLLRDAAATKPSTFRGGDRLDGWVLYRWDTEFGRIVLAYPVRDGLGMVMPSASLLDELAGDAAALIVVEADYNMPHGPSLEAVDAAVPDMPYGTTWKLLERVLGHPAPYWHSAVRDPELMTEWKPGAPAVQVPAHLTPDPGPLLRLAAEEPDGSHAAAAALHTARGAMWREASSALDQIAKYVDTSEDLASIAVAARPLMPHPPEDIAEEILRDGWRMILARPDILAARCARLGQVLGASRYFPGACEITVAPSSCAEAAQWASRLQPSPRTALATYLGDTGEQQILIDPLTDMPAVRTRDGNIETLAPQRLPAISPLAALTIGNRAAWVRTEDGTVFLAPQVMKGGNYTYGYGGGGPRALARLIDTLLDDITNPAPDHGGEQPPAGLAHATQEGWKGRTPPFTLTRSELEDLRDG
ncbi:MULTISPECIES: hypothetical protein [unclassified Streptomyces]|uniref:hypothetical protein n=1 Tax=Streptomyces TaxID=1883 RepID=UPI000F7703FE|nr:hypothetical protein [Streptomyces sp. WAC05858]RSS46292.1 hypothetical protein EF902_12440 [Streptomyces sp. WAC05858]